MTQITFLGRVASAVAAGATFAAITTGDTQVLPSWAPPIEYIGTTTPWLALYTTPTVSSAANRLTFVKVRCYGRKPALESGADCIGTSQIVVAGKVPVITLTYLAVGELTRPQ